MSIDRNCSVTNNLQDPIANAGAAQTGWDLSLVAISSYNVGSAFNMGYQATLELLPFASGAATLAQNSTSTIALDRTYTDDQNNQATAKIYTLIFAQPNNLFPILQLGRAPTGSPISQSYKPITVPPGEADQQNTDIYNISWPNSLAFYQDIAAFPSSDLAKEFVNVLNGANNASSSNDIDSASKAFFAGTKDFQNVSLLSYDSISTYLNKYAFAWATFAASYTYYMYKSSGSNPSTGTSTGATLLGTIVFTQNTGSNYPALNGDPSEADTNYDIVYTDANSNQTNLYFLSGQLLSSTTEDTPTIALQCGFTQLSLFTGKNADAGTIVPILAGPLFADQAIGIFTKMPNDSNWTTKVQNVFSSGFISVFMEITGFLMGLKMVYDGLVWLKEKLFRTEQANGGPVTSEQLNSIREELAGIKQELKENQQQEVVDRLGEDGKDIQLDTDNLTDQQTDLEEILEEFNEENEIDIEEEQLINQNDELEELGNFANNNEMQNVSNDVSNEFEELTEIDVSNTNTQSVQNQLNTTENQIQTDDGTLNQTATQVENQLDQQTQNQLKDSEQAEEDAKEDEEDQEDIENQTTTGEDDEDF